METLSFHRRPLPEGTVSLLSSEGQRLFRESLTAGTAQAFFPLSSSFHTQMEPAWCGLGTLVTVLNALEIDPGRHWKGPWRYFGEELLICCKALEEVAATGLGLAEVDCLARCNGARVERTYADDAGDDAGDIDVFRRAVIETVRADKGPFVVVNYLRSALGQTGTGHFSPIAAWHEESDRVLILDVARFKYPPHWVKADDLWRAMHTIDDATGRHRGWLVVEKSVDVALPDEREVDALLDKLRATGKPMCRVPPA